MPFSEGRHTTTPPRGRRPEFHLTAPCIVRRSCALFAIILLASAPATWAQQNAAPQAPDAFAAPASNIPPGQMLFNFQEAELRAVIKTVSRLTGKNFLIDPRVKGTVTIVSAQPVDASAAYQILLSALRAQGFTAVAGAAGIVKIVPEAEGRQGAPVGAAIPRRPGDQWVTRVVPVQNASASLLAALLRPMMASNDYIAPYAPGNVLIVSGYASHVRNILRIIERIDRPADLDVVVIPLKHSSAVEVADLIRRLDGSGRSPGAKGGRARAEAQVMVLADSRTNSLLVQSENRSQLERVRALVKHLDTPAPGNGNTRVVYLRNARAVDLAETLRGILAGEARAAAARPRTASTGAAAAGAARTAQASLVQADEATNALVINAPDSVFNNLRAVIEKLDVRRAQVFVEALIAEVTSDKAAQFGIQWAAAGEVGNTGVAGIQNFTLGGTGLIQTTTAPLETLGGRGGLTVGFLGKKIVLPNGSEVTSLAGLIRAFEEDSHANILSTPNLLTLDNTEAKIVVGQNIPIITGQFSVTADGSTNPFQTIERQDVGLTLKIRPQISEGSGIKLEIFQEVSSVAPATGVASDVVTNKRSLETTVVVDDGGVIVLGGLVEDRVTESIQAVPLLSKIPWLGELFKFRERRKTKTNLMVFLRPAIVRSGSQTVGFTQDRYEYMQSQTRSRDMSSLFLNGFGPKAVPLWTFEPPKPAAPEAPIEDRLEKEQPAPDASESPGAAPQADSAAAERSEPPVDAAPLDEGAESATGATPP